MDILMFLYRIAFICVFVVLAGCSAGPVGKLATGALQLVGLAKPEAEPAKVEQPRTVPVRVFAGGNLNQDERGRALAVVVKLYKLRSASAFLAAPYEVLADPVREKQALGQDLIEVRELVLTPGQVLDLQEKVVPEAGVMAFVALFRAPAPERWRFTFAMDDRNGKGLHLGVHACAMTVSQGEVAGPRSGDPRSLNGVLCRARS